jgi:hypothetical protein
VDAKQKRARGRPKKNWMEGVRKVMNERNLNEGQWEDRKQWRQSVGQRRKPFWNLYIYIYVSAVLFLYKFMTWRSRRGYHTVMSQGEVKHNNISAHVWTQLKINLDNGASML